MDFDYYVGTDTESNTYPTKMSRNGKRIGGKNTKITLVESWVWSNDVKNLVKQFIKGKSLNVCAGVSNIGDIQIDLFPNRPWIKKMDMKKLEFPDETFDTVISDPPWKLDIFKRAKPFFECVRVCKTGGTIIYNCPWGPTSKDVKLEKVFLRVDGNFTMTSAIWIFKKIYGPQKEKLL